MPVSADPAYQAYLRALGFDEGLARQDAARQKAQATAGAQLAKPELQARGVESRENISDSYEDRGMYLGSERLRDLAGQRRGETYQLAVIDKTRADALAGIEMGMQRELAGINRQRISAQQQHDAYLQAMAEASGPAADPMALVDLGRATQQPGRTTARLSPEQRGIG